MFVLFIQYNYNLFAQGVDKSCDRKRKRKVVNVTSMQEDINKRRSKQVSEDT
jgi:hypothetical protein